MGITECSGLSISQVQYQVLVIFIPTIFISFDDCSWENYYTWARSQGKVGNKEWADFQQFKKGRKLEPDYNA